MRAKRRSRTRESGGSFVWLVLAIVASIIGWTLAAPPLRTVLGPLLTIACLNVLYLTMIYRWDRHVPAFEVATLWLGAASLYGGYPMVNFIAGGLAWLPTSTWMLVRLNPGPAEVASIGWRYALWIGAFVITYLLVRRRRSLRMLPVDRSPGTSAAIVVTAAAVVFFLEAVSMIYNVEYSPRYRDLITGQDRSFAEYLPMGLLRIVHNVVGMRLLLLQAIVALLLMNWRKRAARVALVLFLAAIGIQTIVRAGQRTEFFLLLLTTAILYHRFVRQLTFRFAAIMGFAFLAFFNLAGLLRESAIRGTEFAQQQAPLFAEVNEFQSVFGTTIHVKQMRDTGELKSVPMQVHFSEFVNLVPSPLLPFEKLNLPQWYMELAGRGGIRFGGMMFGAVTQAILGWDWIELAIRGVLLGLFCAAVHQWYVRRETHFWPTIFYMFLGIWMYYFVRQASFEFLYFIVYRFLPTMIAVEIVRHLLLYTMRRVVRRRPATRPARQPTRPAPAVELISAPAEQ